MALLTPEQAAKELAISSRQLRDLTDAGQIKYVNIGFGEKRETRRYTEQDLQEFIDRRKKTWVSTSARGSRTIATTSNYAVSDFLAARAARKNATPRTGSKPKKND